MSDEKSRDVKKSLALALLMLLMGAAGGVLIRARLGGGGGGPEPGAAGSSIFGAALSGQAAALFSKLLSAFSVQGSGRFTFQRLLRLLAKYRQDPLARAFAVEFGKDPQLRGIWAEYMRSRDKLDPPWLLNRLSQNKSFVALLNRYAQDPRFASLVESLARGASEGAIQGGMAQVLRDKDLARDFENLEAAYGAGGAAGGAGAAGRGSARVGAPGAGGGSGEGSTTGARPAAEGRTGEHETLKLASLKAAGPSQVLNPWASLCYKNDSSITRAECSAINEHLGEEALWTACHKAGLLEKCVRLCRTNMELGCASQADQLQACRERHSAAKCAEACSRGDCVVREEPRPNDGDVARLPPREEPEAPPGGDNPGSGESTGPPPEDPPGGQAPPPDDQGPPPSESAPPEQEPPPSSPPPQYDDAPQNPPSSVAAPPPQPPPAPPPKKKKKTCHGFFDCVDMVCDFIFGDC